MISPTPIVCNGLMFIGDPHADEVKPGRRLDEDFSTTILGKLDYLFDYCNQNDLIAVILGDLWEPENKRRISNVLLNRTVKTLKRLKREAIINVGNHDKKNDVLTDEDSLMTLKNTGVLNVLDQAGPAAEFLIGGRRVGLGASPYGQPIPADVTGMFPDAASVVWLTHHDLAFESAYPGSQPVHPIRGCSLVVNGHMHLSKPYLRAGQTIWFNPGNITRQFIDAMEHVPAVHILNTQGKLDRLVVPHQTGIFNITDKLIDPISPGEVGKSGTARLNSDGTIETDFVAMMAVEDSMEMERSGDGSIILEDINEKFERDQTPADVRTLIMHLFDKTIDKARAELVSE